MSHRPWYAHFPADYQRKTAHLSMLEDGAYRRLLDHYYSTAIPLPKNVDGLYRVCRAVLDEERAAIRTVLSEFFILKRDGYHNSRADKEIAEAENLTAIKAEAGRKGGIAARGKSGRKSNDSAIAGEIAKPIANELRKNTPSPSPSPSKKEVSNPLPLNTESSDGFAQFWDSYPRKVDKGQALKAYRTALKKTNAAALLAGSKAYAAERKGEDQKFTKHAKTWLNAESWGNAGSVGLPDQGGLPFQAENGFAISKTDAHDRRLGLLKNYNLPLPDGSDGAMEGVPSRFVDGQWVTEGCWRWIKNTSANGAWQDAFGIGPPPHDPRTLVTEEELGWYPGAKAMRDKLKGAPPPPPTAGTGR